MKRLLAFALGLLAVAGLNQPASAQKDAPPPAAPPIVITEPAMYWDAVDMAGNGRGQLLAGFGLYFLQPQFQGRSIATCRSGEPGRTPSTSTSIETLPCHGRIGISRRRSL